MDLNTYKELFITLENRFQAGDEGERRSGEGEPWPQELWVEGRARHSPFSFEPRALRPSAFILLALCMAASRSTFPQLPDGHCAPYRPLSSVGFIYCGFRLIIFNPPGVCHTGTNKCSICCLTNACCSEQIAAPTLSFARSRTGAIWG